MIELPRRLHIKTRELLSTFLAPEAIEQIVSRTGEEFEVELEPQYDPFRPHRVVSMGMVIIPEGDES